MAGSYAVDFRHHPASPGSARQSRAARKALQSRSVSAKGMLARAFLAFLSNSANFIAMSSFGGPSDAGLDEQLIADLGYLNENEKNPRTQGKLHSTA